MKNNDALFTGIPEPDEVDEFMKNLDHPMSGVAGHLRKLILSADRSVGEGIFWNAPVFFYTGKMRPFERKEYKRYIAGFNFFKKDELRVIFLRGADADDAAGLLTGDFRDKRKLVSFRNTDEVKKAGPQLQKIIRDLIGKINH